MIETTQMKTTIQEEKTQLILVQKKTLKLNFNKNINSIPASDQLLQI